MNVPTEKQKIFFQSLSEEEKILRLKKAICLLSEIGDGHIELLNKHDRSNVHKEIGFAYFYPTVENLWENVKFSLFLGKGQFRSFNFYPARLICENIFRLEYYINQDKKKQNEICLWEMARIMKRFYDESGDKIYKEQYELVFRDFGEPGEIYPGINEDKAYHDPFPSIKKLIEKSKLPRSGNFYKNYQFLCESHHGKLLSLHIAKNQIAQYRRNMFYIFLFCRWLLIITDAHINLVTKNIIDRVTEKAFEIVFVVSE